MTLEEDNQRAFERMLDERESQEKQNINKYRYFEDLYNNQYRWTIYKQKDDKFHAYIYKHSNTNGWGKLTKVKDRAFRKRKDAKSYCINAYGVASNHQRVVLDNRQKRKEERLASKPQYTKEQTILIESKKQIEHYNKLISRADTKIKSAETRKKTYLKRIKVFQKRIERMNQIVV